MITFGYNNKFNGPLRAVAAIALGAVMIMAGDRAFNAVVKIAAVFVIASGVVSIFAGFRKKTDETRPLMLTNAMFDILIGVLLFVFDAFFADLLIYVFGFILLTFGVFQIVALFSANRVFHVGWGSFLLPLVVSAAGVFLLCNPVFAKSWISILAGAAIVVYGASELVSSYKMKKAINEYEIHREETSSANEDEGFSKNDVKDAEYEKVDEQ